MNTTDEPLPQTIREMRQDHERRTPTRPVVSPPTQPEARYIPPRMREQLGELEQLMAQEAASLADTDLRSIASRIFQLRWGLLDRMASEIGVEPKKIHDWAEKMVQPHREKEPEEVVEVEEVSGK